MTFKTQGNIFIKDDGEPCLADFGLSTIARTLSRTTRSVAGLGIIAWLAPEFLEEDNLRKTSAGDVFAFGRLIHAVS
jgi:serine/threonine protein kinase